MKKIMAGIACLLLSFSLTACGGQKAEEGNETRTEGNAVEDSAVQKEAGLADGAETAPEDDLETEGAGQTTEKTVSESEEGQTAPAAEAEDDATEQETAGSVEETAAETEGNTMKITAGDTTFTAELADNSSAEALKELLAEGPLTIGMHDYGSMEKVGPIGTDLPTNDERIVTEAGDIILYLGNSFVIYYDTNTWNFTRLGKIPDVTKEELLEAFGDEDVTITLTLE